MNLDNVWVYSPLKRCWKYHLPAQGQEKRLAQGWGLRTRCDNGLVRVVTSVRPPEDRQMCDECVLADFMEPSVYRFFDIDDVTLYIGCTDNILRRFKEHASAASPSVKWWPRQVRHTITTYPSKPEAFAAETAAIAAECPLYPKPRIDSAKRLVLA